MRIAIDARYLNESYSGIAKYSENLLTHLSLLDQTNEYTVFIHRDFNRRLKLGENFAVVPHAARPVSLRTLLAFGRSVRHANCDFLHCLAPVAPLSHRMPYILTVHDLQPFTVQEEEAPRRFAPSRAAKLLHRIVFPHFVRDAAWLITVSNATRDQLVALLPDAENKTIPIHSGVEETYFSRPEPTIEQMVAKKVQLPPQFVLYIGSAQPNKNLPAMIRAFARCRAESGDALAPVKFIMVVGRDAYSNQCRRLVHSLGLDEQVLLLGPITEEEKSVLYARARLLYSVTRGEGFGFPIVEAQAAGLPVLAGADASVPEVTGDSAVLVDPGDEEMIARKLGEILLDESLRARLAEAGRANARRFSWRTTASEVLPNVYNLLM